MSLRPSVFYIWMLLYICLIIPSEEAPAQDEESDDFGGIYFKKVYYKRAHLPERKERTTNRKLNFTDVVSESLLKRRKRDDQPRELPNTHDPLVAACKNHKVRVEEPLKCYHCRSSTKGDREPECDHKLWKYLKHSEKTRLRETCHQQDGIEFCAKIVQQKLGERRTIRGCFTNATLMAEGQRAVTPRAGCIISKLDGFRQTLCLCTNDLCNSAPQMKGSALYLAFVCSLLVIVGTLFK